MYTLWTGPGSMQFSLVADIIYPCPANIVQGMVALLYIKGYS